MKGLRTGLVALVLLAPAMPLALPVIAQAATCGPHANATYPNDPGFAPAEDNPTSGNTWDNEAWYLYPCIPQTAPLSSDPEGASGMSVSALWNRTPNPQRGDGAVVSYMEGGVNWRIPASCELKDRALLNTGELPWPEDSTGHNHGTYDLNGDGVVNVEDYVHDPRVLVATGGFLHHVCAGLGLPNSAGYAATNITPEDLIVTFGHCQIVNHVIGFAGCPAGGKFDNDGNGYPNDINGWNFNRDNNDPQTEQSIYAHFNDESGQLTAEGNNALGNIGMCPDCRYIPIKAGDEAIDRPDRVAEAIVYAANLGVNVEDVTDASLGLNPTVQAAINYAWNRGTVVVFASNDFESADHTDGMFYAHVWPGNSITGNHSTRNGTSGCPGAPSSPTQAFCAFVESNTTFRSRSSLTSYGPHALFSVPNNDGSTSTGTPTNAGVAALVVAELKARDPMHLPISADEVKQIVRSTALPISDPGCITTPSVEPCFQGPAGASFNIQYGYGRPNLLAAANAVDAGHIPPTASIDSPSWYQEVDPTRQSTLQVTADVAARRAGSYTWQLQYGLGPQPLDSTGWTTFASGSGSSAQTVSGSIDLTQAALQSFATTPFSIDPHTRLSIEQYDVTVRVQVFANGDTSHGYAMGEDRRAFHLHHDPSIITGAPIALGASGDASPTMADIEGRGWLDTIGATGDGSVYAIRPDGTEAPGFPVHTGPAPGMDPAAGHNGGVNYLSDPTWANSVVSRPRDPIFSSPAVGDLTHTGALDVVVSTASGYTYAWDGSGTLLPGFPVLNGAPADFGLSVPPPDTPYSFQPENYTAASPVLAHLIRGSPELDIVQAAGDNAVHAWRPNGAPVPGWPVSTLLPAGTVPAGSQQTHDSKTVPTPAIIDINGDGIPDVVVGLDDSILGNYPAGAGVQTFLMAYDGRGTAAGNGGLLPGYPVKVQGLVQGYGVAQDFVTQGVESPAVYTDSTGKPQAVVNANLFTPFRIDLQSASAATGPFTPTHVPNVPADQRCQPALSTAPTFPGICTLLEFTTSASLGKVVTGMPDPQTWQMGSSGVDVFLGITQTPGLGVRVDNGIGGWNTTTGASLTTYAHYIQGLAFFAAPAIADVTGDGIPDIVIPADSGAVMAIDGATGAVASGFPKWTGGWSVFEPATGDLFGNGQTDVAAATREGYLYLWSTPANPCVGNSESWHWHQNDWNSGQYGQDTRPPSAITNLTVTHQGTNDVLHFTAVGNDWKCGTAAKYDLFTSPSPITQNTVSLATQITVTQPPGPAGTQETITIPASENQGYLAIRAEDAAGNIGPIEVTAEPQALLPEFGAGAASGVIVVTAVAAGVVGMRRRRRLDPAR